VSSELITKHTDHWPDMNWLKPLLDTGQGLQPCLPVSQASTLA